MNYTILINKDNMIKEKDLERLDLIDTKDIYDNDIKVDRKAYEEYLNLKNFLKKKQIEIGISSAYRSIEEQKELLTEYKDKYGQEYCDNYVAEAGCSEHHTGLAIDFYIKENNKYPEDDKNLLENTKEYEKIFQYLKNFGFILRYPKGKEKITKYQYEPWHIRYVGKTIASIIMDNNLTLEEYLKNYSAIIIVNKEKNMTSFDVVNKISKIFGIRKVGHTGTLDPLAEGVLIVCIGQATKVVELLTTEDKEYIAEVKLGITTDTYDIEGKILEEKEVRENLDIEQILNSYKKTYLQEVPIYSAVKVNGKKLYEYARENKKVELPKKEVTIKEIELLNKTKDTFTFKALVTKGCYIRSLISDIGKDLKTGAIMTSLVRTKQGNISIEDANKLEDIEKNNFKTYKIEELLPYQKIIVNKDQAEKISNGMKLDNIWNIKDKVIFLTEDKILLGIYEVDNQKLRVWKNFNYYKY